MATLQDTIVNSTGAAQLSVGTEAQRPTVALNGAMRFNTSRGIIEMFHGGYWRDMVSGVGLGSNNARLLLWIDPAYGTTITGNMITDISGFNLHGTTVGNITVASDSAGSFIRTDNNSYCSFDFGQLNLSAGQNTVIAVSRYNGQGSNLRGRIVAGRNNNWLLGHWNSTTGNYYAEGWVTAVNAGTNDTNWYFHAATGDTAADSWAYYRSTGGTAITSANASGNGGSQGPNRIGIGADTISTGASQFSNADLGFLMVFNKVMTIAEIERIRQTFAVRFSL